MPLPPNVSTVEITGAYTDADGSPAVGEVYIDAVPDYVLDASAAPPTTIGLDRYRFVLDATGEVPAGSEIIATDDGDLNPTGWTYKVVVNLRSSGKRIEWYMTAPAAASPIDLTLAAPVDSDMGIPTVVGPPGGIMPAASNAETIAGVLTTSAVTPASGAAAYARVLTQVIVSGAYTAGSNEYVIAGSTTTPFTVTLPPAPPQNTVVRIKNNGNKTVTVDGNGALIDNLATREIPTQNADIEYRFDGTNWRIGPAFLPHVYLTPQIDTEHFPAGGNTNFCLVIPNQITTGSANDGVHDLVLVLRNNPSIGDADMYITRDDVNTAGQLFLGVPIRAMADGLAILDDDGVPLLDMAASGGDMIVGGQLVGGRGTDDDLVLKNSATANAEIRVQKSDGTDRIIYTDATDTFRFVYPANLRLSTLSGTGALLNTDSTNRLNIGGGGGGIRFLNNAFAAVNLTLADLGDVTVGRGDLIIGTAGKGIRPAAAAGPLWSTGAGTPEGAVTAPVGSLFTRTDGGAGTTLYVKESGAGNTGWVAK